jgi:hypothetical protein
MNERLRILNMLSEGKVTADEAEELLDALAAREDTARTSTADTAPGGAGDTAPLGRGLPKHLYVKVDSEGGDKVDVKIPLALVRSGLKLTSLIPKSAMDQINGSLSDQGISFDLGNFKREDIDELVAALRDMEITVDGGLGDKVRVYAA